MTVVPSFFFFNDTATTEIYTLSLHDALPISGVDPVLDELLPQRVAVDAEDLRGAHRSEEHTSELQSRLHLVCRLLLEKKKYNLAMDARTRLTRRAIRRLRRLRDAKNAPHR